MIAVDTNVLLDILHETPNTETSRKALRAANKNGALIISEVVYAELSAAFSGDQKVINSFLSVAGIELERSHETALALAGKLFKAYRLRGGKRDRIAPDFMIGAHAIFHAKALLTRDDGFYKSHFDGLVVIAP